MPLRSERRPGAVDLMQVEHVGAMYPKDMPSSSWDSSSTETPLGNTLLLTMPRATILGLPHDTALKLTLRRRYVCRCMSYTFVLVLNLLA